MDRLAFYVNKKMVYVELEKTSNKNMYLKIKGDKLVCLKPKYVSEEDAKSFIQQHIEKFVKYMDERKVNELYSVQGLFVYFLGKKYKITSLTGFKKSSIKLKDDIAYVNTQDGSHEAIEKAIKDKLKEIADKHFEKYVPIFEKKMHLEGHVFRSVYKNGTWGTNRVDLRKLSFSSKLAHYRTEIIDYVIVHELAHTYEPNHSTEFWDIVKNYIPNYKELRKELKADQSLSE